MQRIKSGQEQTRQPGQRAAALQAKATGAGVSFLPPMQRRWGHQGQLNASKGSPEVVQRITVGYVPSTPANFRGTTNLAFDGTGVPAPDKAFNGTQRDAVYANNHARGGGAAPIVVAANHAKEDIGLGAALMNRDAVSDIEPEIDHIVPRADGGVNDFDNARVLSKTHNTDGSASRPVGAAKSLRIYQDVTISDLESSTDYHAGDFLHSTDIASLCDYADANPGDMTNIGLADLNKIGAKAKGQTSKGITVD